MWMAMGDAGGGAWVVEVVLRVTVVLALAGMLAVVLVRASAAVRHAVWTAALAGVLMLPVAGMLPGWRVLPRAKGRAVAVAVPRVEVRTPLVKGFDEAVGPAAEADAPVAHSGLQPPVLVAPVTAAPINWAAWGLVLWMTGVVAMLCPLVAAVVYLRRLEKRARPVEGAGLKALEEAKEGLGIAAAVVLVESPVCQVPMTFGLWRPRVVVPAHSRDWTAAQWRMILTHELAHVGRRDIAWVWIGQLARAVYWFHPLAWVAFRQMAAEGEKACDDRVVACGAEAPAYAAALLEMAAGFRGRSIMSPAVLHMARKSTLESRVRRVLDASCRRAAGRWAGGLAAAVLLLTGMLGLLRGAEPARNVAPSAAATATAASPFAARFPSGGTLELVAITTEQPYNTPWWNPDGGPTLAPVWASSADIKTNADEKVRTLLFKVSGFPAGSSEPIYTTANDTKPLWMSNGPEDIRKNYYSTSQVVPKTAKTGSIHIGIAIEPWKTLVDTSPGKSGKTAGDGEYVIGNLRQEAISNGGFGGGGFGGGGGGFGGGGGGGGGADLFSPPPEPKDVVVDIAHTFGLSFEIRVVAVDQAGKEHPQDSITNTKHLGALREISVAFSDMKVEQIKSLKLQGRKMEWVDIKGYALEPRGSEAQAPAGGAATHADETAF